MRDQLLLYWDSDSVAFMRSIKARQIAAQVEYSLGSKDVIGIVEKGVQILSWEGEGRVELQEKRRIQ